MSAKPFIPLLSGRGRPVGLIGLTSALIGVAVWLAPAEQSLGSSLRLVLLHGAWVWAALLVFAGSAVAGLVGLLTRGPAWRAWSRALGLTGMAFWLVYLLMALRVMQAAWGGPFFDEPRWRIPFTFAVAGLLLQLGLWLVGSPRLASLGNLVFGAALWGALLGAENILHPVSPVAHSGSFRIRVFFAVLLALALCLGLQVARMLRRRLA